MIVKTGANYQAEGGYIEASREGDIITIDGAEYNDKYGVYSIANLHIVNESHNNIVLYAGSATVDEAPVYYQRDVAAGSDANYRVIYPGRIVISIPAGVTFNSNLSIGCAITDIGYLRVTDVEATAVFN